MRGSFSYRRNSSRGLAPFPVVFTCDESTLGYVVGAEGRSICPLRFPVALPLQGEACPVMPGGVG